MIHPRQRNSLTLLLALCLDIISQVGQSDSVNYMLETSVVWFLPYSNIDPVILMENRWKQQKKFDDSYLYRKNMNFIDGSCHSNVDAGIDVNRNFDIRFGSLNIKDKCSEQYPGEHAFSQKQSMIFKNIYEQYHLTLAIDIHAYGNELIIPYSFDKYNTYLKQNETKFNFYTRIQQYYKSQNITVQNCYGSLNYTADGVYIDWALQQNVFSFVYQVGVANFEKPDKLDNSIKSSIKLLRPLLVKNSYEFHTTCSRIHDDVQEVTLHSDSLVDLQIQVQGLQIEKYQLKALSSVVIWLDKDATTFIVQLETNNQDKSIYTVQVPIDSNPSELCNLHQRMLSQSINIVVGILSLIFILLCLRYYNRKTHTVNKVQYDVIEATAETI